MARVQIRLAADERTVTRVTGWIERFCGQQQLPRAVTNAVTLSLEEIVSNIGSGAARNSTFPQKGRTCSAASPSSGPVTG
jgi:hypothetical protein